MSYWIKPGPAELLAIYERMGDSDCVKVDLRYAAYDDPTMEGIFDLKGYERVARQLAPELFEEASVDQLVNETQAKYLSTIINGDLGRAAQELAQHGYTAPTASSPGGMPMQQPAE